MPSRARLSVPQEWQRDVLALVTSNLTAAEAERVTQHWQVSGVIETPWSAALRDALHGIADQIAIEWVRPNHTYAVRPRQGFNRNAGDTSNVEAIIVGGATGFDLTGAGVLLGEWDEGAPRTSHRELRGRVRVMDGAGPASHSTAVAGTMIATGIAMNARGMAVGASLLAHDWDSDVIELYTDGPISVASNHSYGAILGWDTGEACNGELSWFGGNSFEDPAYGKYMADAAALDAVIAARDLVVVWAAGNERQDAAPGAGEPHHHWPGCAATFTDNHASERENNFDTLGGPSVIKNGIVIGAVQDITSDPPRASQIVPEAYTSFGPMDDGRIKPDLVASGDDLYTSDVFSDSSYASVSGTSLASPVVTGTIALLAQHYRRANHGRDPRAAEFKALLIQSALDAGPQAGPDYRTGFGLFDAKAAAELIEADRDRPQGSRHLRADAVDADRSVEYVSSEAIVAGTPMRMVLTWHDPAGAPNTRGVDDPTPALVNDLDLVLVAPDQQTVFRPWSLSAATPMAPASRIGPNRVDNVEVIDVSAVDNVWTGVWTVRVSAPERLLPRDQAQVYGLAASIALENNDAVHTSRPMLGVPRRIVIEAPFGSTPAPIALAIDNLGAGDLSWSLSETIPWLSMDSVTGVAPAMPQISFDVSGFSAPTEQIGVIEIEGSDSPSPQLIAVVLRLTCDAACDGRQCGVDPVCGTSCGQCGDARACTAAGTCVALSDACPAADLGQQLGVVARGSTIGRMSSAAGSCGGAGVRDVSFRFRAPTDGHYKFTTNGSSFDTVLYVRAGGCNGAELACNDDSGGMTSSVSLPLQAGEQVTIWVDGFVDEGAFVLTISQTECPDLDLGSALGDVMAADLLGAVNDLAGSCGGASGDDIATLWTAPAAGTYSFTARADRDTDALLYVRDAACQGVELACADAGGEGASETVSLSLSAGQSVVLVIDGAASSARGDVGLSIVSAAASCQGVCGQSPNGACFCDAGCVALGDCCADACASCGRCACVADCADVACGDDGCGGTCGACGAGEVCEAGACVIDVCAGVACEACHACVEGTCLALPDRVACDDGLACTVMDRCEAGVCSGQRLVCDDRNECTTNACDETTGRCAFTKMPGCCTNDGECNDGDVCTNDRCDASTRTCRNIERSDCCHGADECDDDNPCTDDTCLLGACVSTPSMSCDDDAGDSTDAGDSDGEDAGWSQAEVRGGGCACAVIGLRAGGDGGADRSLTWLACLAAGLYLCRVSRRALRARSATGAAARQPRRLR